MNENQNDILDETQESLKEETQNLTPQLFGTTQEVVQRYNHCAICTSYLHFMHVTDFAKNLTHETARCPECAINIRKFTYRLQ